MFVKSALFALGVASAVAGPVYKRQESTVSAPSGASGSTLATATASGTESASSVISSVASEVSSVVSSAATNSSSAPAPTQTGETVPGNLTFSGCPDGYSLTYVIGLSEYPGVELSALTGALSDWATATPPPIEVTESQGGGDVGATRTWTALNLTVMEQLTNVTANNETGSLNQIWNLTMPVTVTPSVVISNATTDLTLYSNSTTNVTSAQFYVNFCVSDQQAGLALYAQLVQAYLGGLPSLVSSSNATSTSSSASSSVASATSALSSSASGAAGTVSSGVSGAAGTVTSAVGGAASTAVSGVTGAVGTAISGGSSVVGEITSALLPSSAGGP